MIHVQLYRSDHLLDLPLDPHGVSTETLEVVNTLVVDVEDCVQVAPSAGRADVVELRLVGVNPDPGIGGDKCELIPARLAGSGGIHGNSSYRLDMGYSDSEGGHTQYRPRCKSESEQGHP